MAAPAVQSVSTTAWASSTSVAVTKPSGLAVGDLMVAHIAHSGFVSPDTAPTGFVELEVDIYNTTDDQVGLELYWKIADADDVAASSFTWGFGGTIRVAGAIARITGFNASSPFNTYRSTENANTKTQITNTANPTFVIGITPTVADCLILFLIASVDNNNAMGGYSLATSSPSFSEAWDMQVTALGPTNFKDLQMSMAYGGRSQTTATGDASITGGDALADWAAMLVAVNPTVITPTLTTEALTNVLTTSALGNGTITATGGANATRRGFCYLQGAAGDPTVSDSTVFDDGDFGAAAYTKSITGLSAGTAYRVRAYAINSAGTSYGNTVDLTTSSLTTPTLTTEAATSIAAINATLNGTITNPGGVNCTDRGFAYLEGASGTPTVDDDTILESGSFGAASYSLFLTGLSPSTAYRVRAYAINSEGTAYGNTVDVVTTASAGFNDDFFQILA